MVDNDSFIPITKPVTGELEIQATRRVLESGWLTQGPEVMKFEDEFAEFVGAKYACAVSNCTVALSLALKAIGVGPGDEVIVPSHSFIATANSIVHAGGIPVFVEIDPRTLNLDPLQIEKCISPKTKVIMAVHQMGLPCELGEIIKIANKHKIRIIEDAACALGSQIRWNGNWECIGKPHSGIACFSFHPRKVITTGDGGMLTTSNASWDRKFRLWRHQGMDLSDLDRHESNQVKTESYIELGYNFRMTDLQAAVGRAQLQRLPKMLESRRQQAKRYNELLSCIPEMQLPTESETVRTNWQTYCVRLPPGVEQRKFMQRLLNHGIATRRGIMCSHREKAYPKSKWHSPHHDCAGSCDADSCRFLRHSEQAQDQCVMLPLFPTLTSEQQERVVRTIQAEI